MWGPKSVISATIAALFVQSLLYGTFGLFFCIILSIALGPKHSRFVNRTRILQISSLMFLLATTYLIMTLIRIFVAFTAAQGFDDLATYLANQKNPLFKVKTCICVIQSMLGDGILVWRCYVLYDKVIWVLIPGIIILILDAGILITYGITIARSVRLRSEWAVVVLVLSIVVHAGYTGAIVWQIYRSTKLDSLRATGRSFTPVVAALIESGAAYSLSAIVLLVCMAIGSLGEIILLDAGPPLVGVIFCLLILQIHVSMKDREVNPSGISTNWSIPWRRGQGDSGQPGTST